MSKIEEILGRDINSLKELREEIKRLQDSIAGVDPETEQFKTTVEQLTAAQEQLAAVTKKNATENTAAKDSIVGMEQEYKNLYNTYKMLTEEQRNSGMGKNMAQDLAVLSDKINNAKKEVGNFKNNIGNYTGSIIDAFKKMGVSVGGLAGPLKTATTGMGSLNAVMKANPIGLIVSAIMGLISLIKSLAGSIKNNEQLQMRWNEAMSAFQPIIDAVKRGLDAVGQVIVSVGEGIGKFVNWLREATGAVTDFLGITQGAQKRAKETNKVYQDLAKSQNELTKSKREYQVLNSKDEAEVERLREEISLTNDKAEKERLVNQAKEIQGQIDARNVEIAKEELRILEEKAKLTPNSAADNQAIANAQANVANATAQASRNQRTLNRLLGKGGAGSAAVDEYKQKAKELYDELTKESKDRITQLREEYEEQKKLLEKYGYDTTLLTKKYNKEVRTYTNELADSLFQEKRTLYKKYLDIEAEYIKTLPPEEAWDILDKRLGEKLKDINNQKIEFSHLEGYIPQDEKEFDALMKKYIDGADGILTYDEAMEMWYEHIKLIAKDMQELGLEIEFPPKFDKSDIDASIQNLGYWFDTAKMQMALFNKSYWSGYDAQAKTWLDYEVHHLTEKTKQYLKDRANLLHNAGLTEEKMLEQDAARTFQILSDNVNYWADVLADEYIAKNAPELRLEAEKEYVKALEDLRGLQFETEAYFADKTQKLWEDTFAGVDSFGGSIQTITNAMSNLIQQEISEGKISEAQAKKKRKQLETLEKVSLAANIFQIAGSTANGIMGIWNAYALERVANAQTAAATGPAAGATVTALNAKSLASAIINTTAMATAGAANIAAATMGTISKLQQFKEDSGGAASAPNMAMIDSSVYSYRETEQNTPESDELNRPIWVSVVDIESALNRVRVVENESRW